MVAENTFQGQAFGPSSSAREAFDITPNDDADLEFETRGVYIGVSGDLHVTMAGGGEVTFTELAGGIVHPLRVHRVHATGTTATNILGMY